MGFKASPHTSAWTAPHHPAPLQATIELPGSKSLTNRELLLASLASGPSTIRAALKSRDSELMVAALSRFGVKIEVLHTAAGNFDLSITPPSRLTAAGEVDCGLAGTVMRFLPPLAALATGATTFDGDAYARTRPMAPLLTALTKLGVAVSQENPGFMPFTVTGTGRISGGAVALDASLSSQFVSALLLSAARFENGIRVTHTGEKLPSVPHIEMTLQTLREHGVQAATVAPGVWEVKPGTIAPRDITIEPDLSNAAPFLAAALVSGGEIQIPNWPAHTTQVGAQLPQLLTRFGAHAELRGSVLKLRGTGTVRGATLHLPEAGELAPTLVGLAALADSPSVITGIGHIRHHETDRIRALVTEINRLGGKAQELPDGIAITPAPLTAARWRTYADHRMATTGALIGLVIPGIELDDIGCTAKTLPTFATLWQQMLAGGNLAPDSAKYGKHSADSTRSNTAPAEESSRV